MFENIRSNFLKTLAFHVEYPMNRFSFWASTQLKIFYLNITVTTSSCVSISESDWDLIEGVENIKNESDQQIFTVSRIVGMKTPV